MSQERVPVVNAAEQLRRVEELIAGYDELQRIARSGHAVGCAIGTNRVGCTCGVSQAQGFLQSDWPIGVSLPTTGP